MPRCQCLTNKGRQCFRNAAQGSVYCFQHKDCKKIKKKSKTKPTIDLDSPTSDLETPASDLETPASDLKTKTFIWYAKPTDIVLLGTSVNSRGADIIKLSDGDISIGLRVGGEEKLQLQTTGDLTVLEHYEFKDWLEGPDYVDLSTISAILIENHRGNLDVGVQLEDGDYSDYFHFHDPIDKQFDQSVNIFINLPEGTTFTQLH